jgi:hypothetical protein
MGDHFVGLVFQGEVAGVEEVKLELGQVALVGCAPSAGKILSFLPQTISVGGRCSGKYAWTAG